MYIETKNGRKYYKCNTCKKIYSAKVGRDLDFDYYRANYCRECLIKLKVPKPKCGQE